MGYEVTQERARFYIEAAWLDAALVAVRRLSAAYDPSTGGIWQGGGSAAVRQHFAFLRGDYTQATTLAEALACWRWTIWQNDQGDVTAIRFTGEKQGDDDTLMAALAPYVTACSEIIMRGEDGACFRWYFDGVHVVRQSGRLVFTADA